MHSRVDSARRRVTAVGNMSTRICLFVRRDSLRARAYATMRTRLRKHPATKWMHVVFDAAMFGALAGEGMTKLDTQARVLEAWFRLPESRRRYATDAVAFAYRLLREDPDLFNGLKDGHEAIVNWLLPHLAEAKTG
jgi:hypothetical protein